MERQRLGPLCRGGGSVGEVGVITPAFAEVPVSPTVPTSPRPHTSFGSGQSAGSSQETLAG